MSLGSVLYIAKGLSPEWVFVRGRSLKPILFSVPKLTCIHVLEAVSLLQSHKMMLEDDDTGMQVVRVMGKVLGEAE